MERWTKFADFLRSWGSQELVINPGKAPNNWTSLDENMSDIFLQGYQPVAIERLIVFCQRRMVFWTSTLLFCNYLFNILSVL